MVTWGWGQSVSSLRNISVFTKEAADQEALEVFWEPQAARKEV